MPPRADATPRLPAMPLLFSLSLRLLPFRLMAAAATLISPLFAAYIFAITPALLLLLFFHAAFRFSPLTSCRCFDATMIADGATPA